MAETITLLSFQMFDDAIFAFFAVEMVIKMVAMGWSGKGSYMADSWNRLDLFIVVAGWVWCIICIIYTACVCVIVLVCFAICCLGSCVAVQSLSLSLSLSLSYAFMLCSCKIQTIWCLVLLNFLHSSLSWFLHDFAVFHFIFPCLSFIPYTIFPHSSFLQSTVFSSTIFFLLNSPPLSFQLCPHIISSICFLNF